MSAFDHQPLSGTIAAPAAPVNVCQIAEVTEMHGRSRAGWPVSPDEAVRRLAHNTDKNSCELAMKLGHIIVVGALLPTTVPAQRQVGDRAATSSTAQTCTICTDLWTFVHQIRLDTVPMAGMSKYRGEPGAEALLIQLLAQPKEEVFWPMIVLTLGSIGSDAAAQALVEFSETGGQGRVLTAAAYRAKTSVPVALGFLVNKTPSGSARDHALHFLRQAIEPEYWQTRISWLSPYNETTSQRNLYLAGRAVQGLGLSGNREALSTLRQLVAELTHDAQPPTRVSSRLTTAELEELRKITEDSIFVLNAVLQRGLDDYYK